MKHIEKVRIARQLQTPLERSMTARNEEGQLTHEPIFQTLGWETRKAEIAARVARKIEKSQYKAFIRKQSKVGVAAFFTRAQQRLQAMRLAQQQRKQKRQQAYNRKHANA